MPPPPRPCSTRNSSSDWMFQAKAQSTELTVNTARQVEKEGLAAEHLRQEAARREHDGIGDEIGRDHPRRLVGADRQAASDVGQRDIGDGGVENLHEGRERHQDRDQPWIGAAGGAAAGSSPPASRRGTGAQRVPRQPLVQRGLGSTRTVGTTDMPGPSATSAGGLSMTIFTGTRWTTLT